MKCPVNGGPCSRERTHSAVSGSDGKQYLVCEACMAANTELKPVDDLGPCEKCGITIDQVVRNSRVGCPNCYDHFGEPLSYIIAAVQFGGESRHTGMVPECHKRSVAESVQPIKFATELAQKVKLMVRAEMYEEAAKAEKTLSEVRRIMERGELGPEDRAELAEIAYRHIYPDSAE